jgi:hypothetical protein
MGQGLAQTVQGDRFAASVAGMKRGPSLPGGSGPRPRQGGPVSGEFRRGSPELWPCFALNGLRVSEATGANIEDLGIERGQRTLVITRKGGKVVAVPLAPRTARAIDLAIGERNDGPIFVAADGRRLDRHGAGRIVRRIARRAGITKPVRPHTLRHAFITAALDAGVPLRDVQEAASHADPRTTMRYDRARTSLDRHATYIVAAYVAVVLRVTRDGGHLAARAGRGAGLCRPRARSAYWVRGTGIRGHSPPGSLMDWPRTPPRNDRHHPPGPQFPAGAEDDVQSPAAPVLLDDIHRLVQPPWCGVVHRASPGPRQRAGRPPWPTRCSRTRTGRWTTCRCRPTAPG